LSEETSTFAPSFKPFTVSFFDISNGSAYYAYSCLTILPDGTIGLLYESDGTVITYEDFDIEVPAARPDEDDGVANKIAVLPSIFFGYVIAVN